MAPKEITLSPGCMDELVRKLAPAAVAAVGDAVAQKLVYSVKGALEDEDVQEMIKETVQSAVEDLLGDQNSPLGQLASKVDNIGDALDGVGDLEGSVNTLESTVSDQTGAINALRLQFDGANGQSAPAKGKAAVKSAVDTRAAELAAQREQLSLFNAPLTIGGLFVSATVDFVATSVVQYATSTVAYALLYPLLAAWLATRESADDETVRCTALCIAPPTVRRIALPKPDSTLRAAWVAASDIAGPTAFSTSSPAARSTCMPICCRSAAWTAFAHPPRRWRT